MLHHNKQDLSFINIYLAEDKIEYTSLLTTQGENLNKAYLIEATNID